MKINDMYLEAKGELKYQMNIKTGTAIETVITFNRQADLIEALEKIKNDLKNDEEFFNYIKENVKINCFCKIEIVKNENTK